MGVGVKIFLCSRLQKGRGETVKKKKKKNLACTPVSPGYVAPKNWN